VSDLSPLKDYYGTILNGRDEPANDKLLLAWLAKIRSELLRRGHDI
jgi:hypothetical protein